MCCHQAFVFSEVEPETCIEIVTKSVMVAKMFNPEVVVGLGGGSALDISKVASIMLTTSGEITSYFGMELIPNPGQPVILVPTVAGTGIEMTSISVRVIENNPRSVTEKDAI